MKVRNIIVSIATASVLFTACGGGGGGGTPKQENPTVGAPSFISPSEYSVVSGSKKVINLTMDKPYTYDSGQPRYKFSIVNKPASVKLKDDVRGVIIYNSPDGGGDTTIQVKAQALDESGNAGTESQPFSITFKAIEKPTTTVVKPQPTKKSIDTFVRNDKYNVEGPNSLVWADNNNNTPDPVKETMSYQSAEEYCVGLGSGWRMPTKDELLDLVDYDKQPYSDTNKVPIIPTSAENNRGFKKQLMNVWAKKEYGREIFFSENTGIFVYKDNDQKLPVRCVKGAEADSSHVIHSDTIEYTYDENTGLEWTPALPAGTVCSTFTSGHLPTAHDGYRTPTINELRSIVENGNVPYFLTDGQLELASSTPYINASGQAEGFWMLQLNQSGFTNKIGIGAGTPADTNKVVCVRDFKN